MDACRPIRWSETERALPQGHAERRRCKTPANKKNRGRALRRHLSAAVRGALLHAVRRSRHGGRRHGGARFAVHRPAAGNGMESRVPACNGKRGPYFHAYAENAPENRIFGG